MERRRARHEGTAVTGSGGELAVAQRVDPNLQRNGRCFVCGGAADVKPDWDHATGYGRYDLVEKDRALFQAWIAEVVSPGVV